MPIIRIDRWTKELKVRVGQYRQGGAEIAHPVGELILTRAGIQSYGHLGWAGEPICPPRNECFVRYPLHEIDEDGYAVFYFDNAIQHLRSGRYHAHLRFPHIKDIVIDIDLFLDDFKPLAVKTTGDNCLC